MGAAPARQETRFAVEGMDCGSCVRKIETALGRLPGVEEVSVSLAAGAVTIHHDARTTAAEIRDIVARLGFRPAALAESLQPQTCGGSQGSAGGCCGPAAGAASCSSPPLPPSPSPAPAPRREERRWWATPAVALLAVSGAAIALAVVVGLLAPELERWAFLAAVGVGLVPVARRAVVAARYGTVFPIEMLMTVAAVAAVAIGAEAEAATVLFLFLIGELLESVAASRARAGIRALADLMPRTCRRETPAGAIEDIAADRVAIGDIIQVRPGDRVAADGVILSGTGGVDESPLTGESIPRLKTAGDPVHAGTINGDSLLRVRVTADARDNTIARIVRLVEEAQEKKAPTARFIERFARSYTPAIVAVAVLVAIVPPLFAGGAWHDWIYRAAALLLIGCPCALVISTPAAIAAGLSAGARQGLLMKGGAVLEALGRTTLVAFDKTGTLTEGRPQVTDVIAGENGDTGAVLSMAAALSAGSSHPVAAAILRAAEGLAIPAADHGAAVPGKGVEARIGGAQVFLGSPPAAAERAGQDAVAAVAAPLAAAGRTVSVLVRDGAVAGAIGLRDTLRPDAAAAIARLRTLGIEAVMLTGDSRPAASRMAAELGITVHAELLPEQKLDLVRRFQADGAQVAKVGDGINDAPALAAAQVGIAMGGGTDVALETADAASLHARVGDIPAMVVLSRRTLRVVRQNVALALGLKLLLLVTTVAGVTGLWPAVLADTGATVLVTANALRLLRRRAEPAPQVPQAAASPLRAPSSA
ncbi:heavy metal translocating P-type ATPase [Caenispirillum bisanense]|uniref:heavy metal translocating P-type ATPase n=1 Tax=Caenispirillum bisanense TaxID=414052 RepID=UPI0031CF2438